VKLIIDFTETEIKFIGRKKRGGSSFSFYGPDRLQLTPLPQQTNIKRKGGGTKVRK
jgi:hypothetical protein